MSTTTVDSETGPARSYPEYYDNARDYVLDHLDPHEPQSPVELAEQYGCGGDHMRGTLADLAESGEIERVSRGQYVLPEGEADTDTRDHMGSDGDDTTFPNPDSASTAELYEQQHTQSHDDEDHAITSDDAGSDDQAADLEAGPAASLPVDPMALGAILAVAVGLWLLYRGAGAGESPDASSGAEAATDDLPDGGLIDV